MPINTVAKAHITQMIAVKVTPWGDHLLRARTEHVQRVNTVEKVDFYLFGGE